MCFFFSVFCCSKNVFLCFQHHFISPRFLFSYARLHSFHTLGSLTFSSTYFLSLSYIILLPFIIFSLFIFSLILSILSNFLLFHIFFEHVSCNVYMYMYMCICVYDIAHKCVGKVVGCACNVCGRIRWILPHDWVYTIK